MGELRHDARACRSRAESEVIRRGLGIETPAEREARERREAKREREAQRRAALGEPLGLEVEP